MSRPDPVPWSPGFTLSWADFQAEQNPAELEDAYSAIRYRPRWTVGSEQSADGLILFEILDLRIAAEFWPVLSWARPDCDDAVLRHQQGHFDLGELVVREEFGRVRGSVCGMCFPTRGRNKDQRMQNAKEDSALVVESVVRKLEVVLAARQAQYDRDTRHGADSAAQSRFDDILRKSLRG